MSYSIYEKTIMYGGATLDASTLDDLDDDQKLDRPYVVGGAKKIKERSFDLTDPATPAMVDQYVSDLSSAFLIDTVGTWVDHETGKIVIDAVDRFSDLAPALRVAQDRGERAIFDLADFRVITVQSQDHVRS